MKVRTILKNKKKLLITVSGTTTVFDALKLMGEFNIGALVVIEDDQLLGIFSERDYARKIALKGKSSHDSLINEIMTTQVFTIGLEDSLETCMEMMSDKHIRHLPILEEGKVVGMISIGDVVNAIIEAQKVTIDHLESYIRNS